MEGECTSAKGSRHRAQGFEHGAWSIEKNPKFAIVLRTPTLRAGSQFRNSQSEIPLYALCPMLYAFFYTLSMKRICLIALRHPILTADKFSPEVSSPHFFFGTEFRGKGWSHIYRSYKYQEFSPFISILLFILRVTINDAKIVQKSQSA